MVLARPGIDHDVLLYYSGAWQSIVKSTPCYVRMDGLSTKRGTPGESTTADPSEFTCTIKNVDGRFTPNNPASPLYGLIGRNTPIKYRVGPMHASNLGLGVWNEDATVTDWAGTPDNAALDITGDIDIAAEFTALVTTNATMTQTLISKGVVSAGGAGTQFSYSLLIGASVAGVPHVTLRWSTNGTTVLNADHDMADVLIPGAHVAIRVTLDVVNGANRVISFYTATSIAGPWTLHGAATTTAGNTSIFSSTGAMTVGQQNGIDAFAGSIHAVLVKNGIIGTAVANPTFNTQTIGAASFADAAGRTWTLVGGAYLGYLRFTRFTGEVSAWPRTWDVTGRNVTAQITAGGITRRLAQGRTAALQDPMTAFLVNDTTFARYWPGDTAADYRKAAPMYPVGLVDASFGGGDLGLGSKVIGLVNTNPTVDAFGYYRDGYIEGGIGVYDVNHLAAGYAFSSNGTGLLALILPAYFDAANNSTREWQLSLNGDGLNNNFTLKQLTRNYTTGVAALTTVVTTTSIAGQTSDGRPHTVFVTFDKSGADIAVVVYYQGVNIGSGTVVGQALAGFVDMHLSYFPVIDGLMNVGYLSFFGGSSGIPSAADFDSAALRNLGELAADRLARIASENDIDLLVIGAVADTMPMGPQVNGTLLSDLSDPAATDLGVLLDARTVVGLDYHTRASLYGADPIATISYTDSILAAPPEPTDDDLSLHNDVTATSPTGGSARQVLTSGPLSTQSPPNGVNAYPTSVQANPAADGYLDGIAGWLLAQGTINAPRYPSMTFNMARTELTSDVTMMNQLWMMDATDQLTLTDLPAWEPADEADLIVLGLAESGDQFQYVITANCGPADLYQQIATYDSARYDLDTSTVNTGFTSTATSASIATAAGSDELWSTTAGDYPQDFMIAGEQITVSAVSGASSPQTFTISARHVNGVTKAHLAGESVHIYPRYRYGL